VAEGDARLTKTFYHLQVSQRRMSNCSLLTAH